MWRQLVRLHLGYLGDRAGRLPPRVVVERDAGLELVLAPP
jgi:hypothetical protein